VLDADLQHQPALISLLLQALQRMEADVVVANRNIPSGGYEVFSTGQRLGSRVATGLADASLRRARPVSGSDDRPMLMR